MKALSLVVISVGLTLSGSLVFAKTDGPSRVRHSSATSIVRSNGDSGPSERCLRHGKNCVIFNPPGSTQPPCRGGRKGPNGVVIRCD
jgi:hypothetical protein